MQISQRRERKLMEKCRKLVEKPSERRKETGQETVREEKEREEFGEKTVREEKGICVQTSQR